MHVYECFGLGIVQVVSNWRDVGEVERTMRKPIKDEFELSFDCISSLLLCFPVL